MSNARARIGATLILAALVSAACSTSTSGTSGEAQGGGGHATTTCGAGGTGGEVQQHFDLFACGLALDCEQVSYHNFPEPKSALTCFAHHVVSTAPAVLSILMVPGPDFVQLEHLIITLGDGTALVQVRFRCTTAQEWELRVHRICDVEVDPAVVTACNGGDEACLWMPGLTNCEDVADWTCADVTAALD